MMATARPAPAKGSPPVWGSVPVLAPLATVPLPDWLRPLPATVVSDVAPPAAVALPDTVVVLVLVLVLVPTVPDPAAPVSVVTVVPAPAAEAPTAVVVGAPEPAVVGALTAGAIVVAVVTVVDDDPLTPTVDEDDESSPTVNAPTTPAPKRTTSSAASRRIVVWRVRLVDLVTGYGSVQQANRAKRTFRGFPPTCPPGLVGNPCVVAVDRG